MLRSLLLIGICILTPKPAFSADWVSNVTQDCYGDVNVASGLSVWWSSAITIKSSGVAGRFHVQADKSLADDSIKNSKLLIADQVELDKQKSNALRGILNSLAADYRVPVFIELATNIYTGLALPPITGTLTGIVSTYFFQQLNAPSDSARDLALFIADGGFAMRTLTFKRAVDSAVYAVVATEYRVKVGREDRRSVIYACVYPVVLTIQEFKTEGQFNNKIVKPRGADWGIWDLDGSKWDSAVLRWKEQQPDYVYFDEDEIENGRVTGITSHRLSLVGGPWQMKRSSSPNYRSLYAKINAN